jgi:DNA polymerase III sliding clamp (beta) subunit (PCNA family)
MKVNRLELRNILAALKPGLAKREFVAQLCHFLFLPHEIVTYNDKICISHPYECDTPFSVKGEEFFRLIDGMDDEEVTIIVEESKVKIRSKSTSATMKVIAEDMKVLPEAVAIVEKSRHGWKPLPKEFTEGISLCAFSASPDLSSGIKACVWVLGDTCYAIDHARSSRYKMSSAVSDDLYIVGKEAMELAKFPVIEYCTDGKWGHFRTDDDVVFSCMLMKGTFPLENVIRIYDAFKTAPSINFPKELKSITDSIVILADSIENNSGRRVDLVINRNEIKITASRELGSVDKFVDCEYSGEPINVGINARFLSQILGKATSFAFDGNLVHFGNGPFQHVMSQTRKAADKKEEK